VPTRHPLPHGVFLGSHAVAEGVLTRDQLQRGLYRRVLRNVYADPALPHDHALRATAAALLMPPGAALGGRSAAVWWGAPTAGSTDPVLVVVPPGSAWRGPRGVRVHRSELRAEDILVREDGLRITSAERTARDVAALERIYDAVACLDAMLACGALSEGVLLRMQRAAAGQWGSRRIHQVVPLVDGRAQSPPESWVRVACHLAGLPHPVPQCAVVHDGVLIGIGDLGWPEAELIVEYEGAYHFDGLQIVKDDARYARFSSAGWRVIRLSSADLRDLDSVVARIKAELATAVTR
jgi:uncharacterized protein DUF559